MFKRTLCILLLLCFFSMKVHPLIAADVPSLNGRVNDNAGMLSEQTRQLLEQKLAALEASDSTQIVLLTITSLEGESLEEYSLKVAETWGIGQKDIDNGALLLIAKNDRKIRIEVGYGLEGELTDLLSGRIIDSLITPSFKEGDFDGGVTKGVEAMIAAVKGEFTADDLPSSPLPADDSDFGDFFAVLIFVTVFLNKLGSKNRIVAALAGAIIFPVLGSIFFAPGMAVLFVLLLVGSFLGFILGSLFTLPSGTSSSGGSGWSSGGSSGGFGGGFSGGGGGFGGGGASGGW